jgi:hypothetical protein
VQLTVKGKSSGWCLKSVNGRYAHTSHSSFSIFHFHRHQKVRQIFWFIPIFRPGFSSSLQSPIKILITERAQKRPAQKGVNAVNDSSDQRLHSGNVV